MRKDRNVLEQIRSVWELARNWLEIYTKACWIRVQAHSKSVYSLIAYNAKFPQNIQNSTYGLMCHS